MLIGWKQYLHPTPDVHCIITSSRFHCRNIKFWNFHFSVLRQTNKNFSNPNTVNYHSHEINNMNKLTFLNWHEDTPIYIRLWIHIYWNNWTCSTYLKQFNFKFQSIITSQFHAKEIIPFTIQFHHAFTSPYIPSFFVH
jgi:hypothetical protein